MLQVTNKMRRHNFGILAQGDSSNWIHVQKQFVAFIQLHFLSLALYLPSRSFSSKHPMKFHFTWHTIVFIHFINTKIGTEALLHWLLALVTVEVFALFLSSTRSSAVNSFYIRNLPLQTRTIKLRSFVDGFLCLYDLSRFTCEYTVIKNAPRVTITK